ncbi:hypothetical protein DFJ73DRAFT_27337 [Zopfochytrium polystomum]|nr:hypothetical protein DFJ73DRAFT_27337 [Zopfochytrium polystomum]
MIDKLSVDILISVADLLPAASDRCDLSATRRHLRIALAPSVFHSVRATNIEQDRAAIAALSAAHGQHIRHIRFQCMLHGNPLESSEVEENTDSRARDGLECGDDGRRSEERRDLSASGHGYDNSQGPIFEFVATDILLGKIAPNIRALTLEFVADQEFEPDGCKWVDDHHGIGGSIYISAEAESLEDAAIAEKNFEWRRVMANIWRAVASNLTIRSLTVRSLPPNITTTWHRPEWAVFVGQLEHLALEMWGGKSDSDFCSITTNGYQDFLSRQLKTLIFDHAHSLLSLGFVSNEFGTYGGTFIDVGAETAFGSSNMPRLLKFRAENCFFDAPLLEFLRSHTSTLETIHLVNCMAAVSLFPEMEEPNPTWKGLFGGILGAEPHI